MTIVGRKPMVMIGTFGVGSVTRGANPPENTPHPRSAHKIAAIVTLKSRLAYQCGRTSSYGDDAFQITNREHQRFQIAASA